MSTELTPLERATLADLVVREDRRLAKAKLRKDERPSERAFQRLALHELHRKLTSHPVPDRHLGDKAYAHAVRLAAREALEAGDGRRARELRAFHDVTLKADPSARLEG